MTFGGFLDGQASVGRTRSAGPSTDFVDTTAAAFDFTWKNFTTAAAIQYEGNPLYQRNDLIKQRFGKDIYDITELRKKYPNPNTDGRIAMAKEANVLIDDWIAKGRQEFPEKYNGIKTSAEIKENARNLAGMSEKRYNETMIRNPSAVSRVSGGFVGAAGATLLDPPNLLTLPLGAGPVATGLKGFGAARAIMKAAVVDGVINAGVEAMSQPAIMAWQNNLGKKYGFGDAAENVALAFVGGTGLSGILRGAGRTLRGAADYAGSVSADILDRIASSEKLPASVRDAAAFMSRQAHIDESAPPGRIKTDADLKAHRDTAQRTMEEFENYGRANTIPDAVQRQADTPVSSEAGIPATEQIQRLPASEYLNRPEIPTKEILDQYSRVEDVPLDMVRSHQKKMEWEKFKAGDHPGERFDGYADKPVAVRLENGEYLIHDGNHRTVMAINEGKKSLPMTVVDAKKYDPANAGRKAAKVTKGEVDDLMAELTGSPGRVDNMQDLAPPERIDPAELPEGLSPEVSADRVAIAESNMKALVDDLGETKITLDDGRSVSMKDFADEIQAKKRIIEAMKTCRIA